MDFTNVFNDTFSITLVVTPIIFIQDMAYFNYTLRILGYIVLSLINEAFAKDDFVLRDQRLVSHVFQTVYTDDWLNCVRVCFEEARCISYNFKIYQGPCELNDCGLEDICHRDETVIYSRGFVFQQLRATRKVNTLT